MAALMAQMNPPLTAAERALHSVFVGNIPYEATEEQLKEIFQQAGPVISFRLVYDRETGKPKGYGFCEYQDTETAHSAMRNLNNYDFNGRPLRVGVAAGEQNRDEMKGMQQALGGPQAESLYGEPVEPEKAPEAISRAVASLPPEQMFELMRQMKMCIQNNPTEARNMLLQNPQLAYALLQAQIVMKIIEPQVAMAMLHRDSNQIPPASTDNPPASTPEMLNQPGKPPLQQIAPVSMGGPGGNMPGPPISMGVPGGPRGPGPAGPGGPVQPNRMMGPGMIQDLMGGPPRGQMMGPGGPGPGPQLGMGGPRPGMGGPMGGPQMRPDMGGPPMHPDMGGPRPEMHDPRALGPRVPQSGLHGPGGPGPVGGPGGPAPGPRMPQGLSAGLSGLSLPANMAGLAAAGSAALSGSQISAQDQEKAALIMQVLQLTDQQIAMLPPDQRQSILILKDQIAKSAGP